MCYILRVRTQDLVSREFTTNVEGDRKERLPPLSFPSLGAGDGRDSDPLHPGKT